MYGGKEDILLTQIARGRFNKLKQSLNNDTQSSQFVTQIAMNVDQKLSQQAAHLKRFTQSLDEEQEKELEHELEEQCQVERPPPVKAIKPQFEEELLNQLIKRGASHECFRTLIQNGIIMNFHMALFDKQFYAAFRTSSNPWADNLYATRDFVNVIEKTKDVGDAFLRPVCWVAKIKRGKDKDVILLFSSFEVEHCLKEFQRSEQACLYMYVPKMSQFQRTLIDEAHLSVTKITKNELISINDRVQLGMFSGSMYFDSEREQKSYCNFMGLIPRPRSPQQQIALEKGLIQPNGFVLQRNRNASISIRNVVRNCRFGQNPTQLAIGIIEARHQFIRKESHVASILEKCTKMIIHNND